MPLIATQHILHAVGLTAKEALDDLASQMGALPEVRIVAVTRTPLSVKVVTRVEAVSLVVVVEEV